MTEHADRQGKEYSMEVVERCEELYCIDGQPFDAVATLTGVAASTLKRWSERYGWQEKKEQIRQAMSAIRTNRVLVRAKMLQKCLEEPSAKDALAVSALENMAMKAADLALKQQAAASPPRSEEAPAREIRTEEDAVAALEEAVQMKLNLLLADPVRINLAAIKDVKQVMELLSEMRIKAAQAAESETPRGERRGIDKESLNAIRERVYGVS